MNYWQGNMNWPLDESWVCPICEKKDAGLTWGPINGECRCNECHSQYYMLSPNKERLTVPVALLKDEFVEPAKWLYKNRGVSGDEATDREWWDAFVAVGQDPPFDKPKNDDDYAAWDDDPGLW